MALLDYCPFCGYEEIHIKTRTVKLGIDAHAECGHCKARGGHFTDETKELAIESVIDDWNQRDLRPKTLCHRVRRMITQIEYDISCYWYKLKHWDF